MIDSVWKIATTKNASKFMRLVHAMTGTPTISNCLKPSKCIVIDRGLGTGKSIVNISPADDILVAKT